MNQNKKIAGLILAAGFSSRMGKIKPLLPIGSVTLLERVISSFFAGGINDIFLVLGHYQNQILSNLPYKDQINIIYNPLYPQGMLSSIRAGINAISDTAGAFLMTPADYPLIDPKTINDIKACYEETKSSIICPVFEGKTGHPCLFSMKFKNDILNKDLKLGLRSILKENFSDIKYIKSENPYITIDMDTQSDYKQVLNLLKTAPPFWCDIADEILKKDKTPSNIVNHGKAVAKLSKIIAGTLIAKGYNIDLDLLISAAKLHDFKKSEKAHAAAGGTFLSDLGYPTLGKIVKSHMGDGIEINKTITEKEILFLADKMIKGTSLVSIENRFSFSYKKFRNCKEIISEIKHRENMARKIKRQIEDIIDKDLDTIISEAYYE